ncbi:MAG: hypothetical protein ACI9RU_003238, partial [Litorivivens sp.]
MPNLEKDSRKEQKVLHPNMIISISALVLLQLNALESLPISSPTKLAKIPSNSRTSTIAKDYESKKHSNSRSFRILGEGFAAKVYAAPRKWDNVDVAIKQPFYGSDWDHNEVYSYSISFFFKLIMLKKF